MSDEMFDIFASRDEAIDRVEENAAPEFKEVAYGMGWLLAHQHSCFNSEDVWDAMPEGVTTHEPRAMGAVMRRLHRDGIITPTEQFVVSTSPRGHGRPSRIWKSLMYRSAS